MEESEHLQMYLTRWRRRQLSYPAVLQAGTVSMISNSFPVLQLRKLHYIIV